MVLSVNGVSAWVEVDGKELEQYGVKHNPNKNRATCWIATQVDKKFAVKFRDDVAFRGYALESFLELDGTYVGGKILRPSTGSIPPATRTATHETRRLTATTKRPFMFSKLDLTDEEACMDRHWKHLGEIKVSVRRVLILNASKRFRAMDAIAHNKLHERSKKAVTQCVSYGEEVATAPYCGHHIRKLDAAPLATFVFRYRDIGFLQAKRIVPLPPPVPKMQAVPRYEEDVLDLTNEDDIKLEPSVVDAGTRARKTAISNKRSNASHERERRSAKRVKREDECEIIDLT